MNNEMFIFFFTKLSLMNHPDKNSIQVSHFYFALQKSFFIVRVICVYVSYSYVCRVEHTYFNLKKKSFCINSTHIDAETEFLSEILFILFFLPYKLR